MKGKRTEIELKAVEELEKEPGGLRFSEIVRRVSKSFPEINVRSIAWTIWAFLKESNDIYKPERGLFKHVKFRDYKFEEIEKKGIKEEDFYQPFADWLVNEMEEATKAIPLGKNKFKDKWGTPDVIGIREPSRSDIVKFPTEVISAEIKTDSSNLIAAFGQACSYLLFSHKVYLVIPKQSPDSDISRIDSLCLIFGIGLVLFDADNKEDPKFEIRVRPTKHEPDIFYTNKYLKLIEEELFGEQK